MTNHRNREKEIENYSHDEASRLNIPTMELRGLAEADIMSVKYARNKALKTTLRAEIDEDAWMTLNGAVSRPFDKPESGRIAVKVINHLGDEVMKVFRV